MANYFLGIDCSTQSLRGIIIHEKTLKILTKININYDNDLPHYQTENGVYVSQDGKEVHSNPLIWVEALEMLFDRIKNQINSINQIKTISGSAQQHGTVYLKRNFSRILKNLDSKISLASQIKECFSRQTSPVWMDSSTSKQCREIREAMGGLVSTIKRTGSDTSERFSGPQIRKFYQDYPEKYNNTATIHLISSFLSSLLLSANSPIDHADGSGMNLMNIVTKEWDEIALSATAPNLKEKLPSLTESSNIIGTISPYFIERYGFSPETKLVVWSGDNPNSLIGVGIADSGKVAISLGTSDTYFNHMKTLYLDFSGESHVFRAPTGNYMGLICFKNGSLARERIKDQFDLDWKDFNKILEKTAPGNKGRVMLPYFFPEIVPLVLEPKVYRFGFNQNDVEANVRGIIEAQFLSMRHHSQWIKEKPSEIIATGGGSENRSICQIIANIFNTKVRISNISDSAALGAALRCLLSYQSSFGRSINVSEIQKKWIDANTKEILLPSEEHKQMYDKMTRLYQKYEEYILRNGENPEQIRKNFVKDYF